MNKVVISIFVFLMPDHKNFLFGERNIHCLVLKFYINGLTFIGETPVKLGS